jgi:hypothetical protein
VRHDEVDLEPDELGREVGQALVLALGPAKFNDDVPALDLAQLAQAQPHPVDLARSLGR